MLGILDPSIALAFDFECEDILFQSEQEREFEREKRQLELLTGQAITSSLGGSPQAPDDRSKVERW